MILTAVVATDQSFLDSKILHTLIGAFISIVTLVVNNLISGRREKLKYKQTILSWLIISNSSLFSLIYKFSCSKDNIDYLKLRSELEKTGSFIYVLPEELKKDFLKLYQIHQLEPEKYKQNQNKIYPLLVSIVDKLNKYGVEAFGNN